MCFSFSQILQHQFLERIVQKFKNDQNTFLEFCVLARLVDNFDGFVQDIADPGHRALNFAEKFIFCIFGDHPWLEWMVFSLKVQPNFMVG